MTRWDSPPDSVPAGRSSERYPSPISTNESSVCCNDPNSGATDGSSSPRSHSARSVICMAETSAMLCSPIRDERAPSLSRVPSHSGHVVKTTARSTNARMCGCMASTSLDNIDFWIRGISPSNVTLMPSALIFTGSLRRRSSISRSVNSPTGLAMSKNPDPE